MAKRWRCARNALIPVLAAAYAVVAAPLPSAFAADSPVWRDPATGLAIGGYDPVAYFVEGSPRRGREAHEFDADGAAWRFESGANLAVFERDPDVYAPQYGGHDPAQLADGFVVAGNPVLWAVVEDRLYLFSTAEARRRWLGADDRMRSKAEAGWAKLVKGTL